VFVYETEDLKELDPDWYGAVHDISTVGFHESEE